MKRPEENSMKKKDIETITSKGEDRREYFRMDVVLSLNYELVSQDSAADKETSPPAIADFPQEHTDSNDTNSGLFNLLKSIDYKLSYIIKSLSQNTSSVLSLPLLKLSEVNVSAGGVRFKCREEFTKGSILKITLGLPPSHDSILLSALGEVVRVEKSTNKELIYDVAVRFLNLDDEARKDIMKYLLNAQRDIILKRINGG